MLPLSYRVHIPCDCVVPELSIVIVSLVQSPPKPHYQTISLLLYSLSSKMDQISIGMYLFNRMRQLGVKTVFGVPGGKSYHHHLGDSG